MNRRDFLLSAAATTASMTPQTRLRAASEKPGTGYATLRCGELTAVVGDNSAADGHRAGYNGIWSLHHAKGTRSLFVPGIAGLNLEHIVTGEHLEDEKIFFEPRNAPMTLTQVSETEVELHQPPTPISHVESWTRFRLGAPHYLEMDFRCRPHEANFPRGYLSLFWASYLNAPDDKSLYFLGGPDERKNQWTQLCTQWHNDQSTVRHRDDTFAMTFPEGGRDTLFKSLSRFRFDEAFFYGHFDEFVWIVMFDRAEGIRFTHSPSGGGVSAERHTTHPAWDFQFLIPDPLVGKEYCFKVRTALRPRGSREEIIAEYRRWRETR